MHAISWLGNIFVIHGNMKCPCMKMKEFPLDDFLAHEISWEIGLYTISCMEFSSLIIFGAKLTFHAPKYPFHAWKFPCMEIHNLFNA